MSISPEKKALLRRLAIVKGQLDGLGRMLESEENDCQKILIQVKAAQTAIRSWGEEFIKLYAQKCLASGGGKIDAKQVETLISSLMKG